MSEPEQVSAENITNTSGDNPEAPKPLVPKVKEFKSSVPRLTNLPLRNAYLEDDDKEKEEKEKEKPKLAPQSKPLLSPGLKPLSSKLSNKQSRSVPLFNNLLTSSPNLLQKMKKSEAEKTENAKEKSVDGPTSSEVIQRKNSTILSQLTSPRRSTPIGKEASPEELDKITAFGSLCVLDAFQGRLSSGLATNSKKSKLIYNVFCLQTSEMFLNVVVYSSILHTLMTFFEHNANASLVQFVQIAIFLVQFSDFAMKIFYQGHKDYFKTGWHYIFTASIFAHFLDLCWNGQTYYSDPLRPVVGLLRSRSGRRFFSVVQKMIPTFSQSLAPLSGFILIVTFVSFSVFRLDNDLTSMLSVGYNWIWLVLTNDSFSRLYEDGVSLLHTLFFFTALYLGQRFIMSIFLAATFDTFGKFTKKQVKTEKLKELQGLVKAFSVLDTNKEGSIYYPTWHALLKHLDPSYTNEQIALYFEISSEGNDNISLLQFLELKNVLSFKFFPRSQDKMLSMSIFLKKIASRFMPSVRFRLLMDEARARRVLTFVAEWRLLELVNFIDIIVLTSETMQVDYYAVYIINFIYLFEFYCVVSIEKGNVFNAIVDAESWFSWVSGIGILGILIQDLFPGDSYISVRSTFIFLRACRLFHLNHELVVFLKAVIDVVPLFSKLMIFAFIVAYIFAMLGHLLFGQYVEEWSSPLGAMVVIQKLFLPVDLIEIMEATMTKVHPFSIFFFFANFLLSLIICNLSLSIVIDWYSDSLNNFKEIIARENEYENVFKAIYSRVRGRDRDGINYEVLKDYIMAKENEQGDHRSKFIQGEETFNVNDLKQCQKYATIDLVDLYVREKKKTSDLNWVQNFLSKIKEASLPTIIVKEKEEIYKEGKKAKKCFILVGGVATCYSEGRVCDVTAVNVLGGNTFFSSGGVYEESCVAVDTVECLVLTKKAILDDILDPYLLGQILRLAHKTRIEMEMKYDEV